jgi:hypothetical protein
MVSMGQGHSLYHVVCGAPPAAYAGDLVELAKRAGWEVCVVATPLGTGFVDLERLAELAGRPVCHHFKRPSEEDPPFPQPNAIAVAPATFNTVNKLVAGIADTLALALLCGYPAASVPIVVAPNVSPCWRATRSTEAVSPSWGNGACGWSTSRPRRRRRSARRSRGSGSSRPCRHPAARLRASGLRRVRP